jgi:uncharacterized membrane protein (UPF0127 family)
MRGLMGRRALLAGEGMLLTPAPAIHTAFMRFPIDALFLDRNLRVLDIVERLRPWRVASERRARSVLELAAGESARRGVEVGDRLELRDRKGPTVRRPDASDPVGPGGSGQDVTSVVQRQMGLLAGFRPLRVLVISHDAHFRSVMSLLLARRNCSVTATANTSRLPDLIGNEGADVVVIDASRASATPTLTTVQAHGRPVGVVLVADERGTELDHPPVLAKWGPFGDLLAAIERADERRVGRDW